MTQHISDGDLERFVTGELDEVEAVEVARHLDECVSCSNRAIVIDPLAPAFAAIEDPEVPDDFGASVLAQLERPRLPLLELGIGVGLLLVAAGLIVVVDGPVRPIVDSFSVARAAASVISGFASTLSLGEQTAILMVTLVGAIGTLRLATGDLSGGLGRGRRTA